MASVKNLGYILTSIDGHAVKLDIKAIEADDRAKSQENVFAIYQFDISPNPVDKRARFHLDVEDDFRFSQNLEFDHRLHRMAVLSAIGLWQADQSQARFLLNSELFQSISSKTISQREALIKALELIYTWRQHDYGIGLTKTDLELNFNLSGHDRNAVYDVMSVSKYIVLNGEVRPIEFNGPTNNEDVFKLNVEKEEEIQAKLRKSASLENDRVSAFISYSSLDKVYAGELQRALEPHGIDCFLAHEDIEVSDDWALIIRQRWNASVVFFTLLSDNFTGSCYCLQESGAWLDEKKIIMPLVISDLTLGDKELRKVVGFLTAVHFVKVQNLSMDETVELILKKLESKGLIRRHTKTA